MSKITYHHTEGAPDVVDTTEGSNIMRTAVENGVADIIGECGGQAMCATCHVYVRPEWLEKLPEISEDEDEMLDCTYAERTERSRLGCQIEISAETEGIEVDVPRSQFS